MLPRLLTDIQPAGRRLFLDSHRRFSRWFRGDDIRGFGIPSLLPLSLSVIDMLNALNSLLVGIVFLPNADMLLLLYEIYMKYTLMNLDLHEKYNLIM